MEEHLLEKQQQPEAVMRLKLWEEVGRQARLAGPMIGVNVMQFSLQLVSVMFVGHVGELSLASVSIATSLATVSGFSILLGMGGALETLCGQAYGSMQFHLLGLYLQRGILVLNFTAILASFIWFNMEKILLGLHQDPAIAAKAGEYARWLIPGLFAYASLQCVVKFLQAQAVVLPMLLCSCITLLVHIPVCFVLVFKLNFGNVGAALASSFSNWLNLVLLLLYIRFSKTCSKTWSSFSREAFHDLKGFIKLAIPSMIMVCFEWWAFELLVLLSGLLPNPQLETSTLAICLNSLSLFYMIPFGLSAAVSTRISNELGAGHPIAAQNAVHVAISLSVIEALLVGSFLISVRHIWGWVFSNELKVVQHVAFVLPFLTCIAIMDAIQGVLSAKSKCRKMGEKTGTIYFMGEGDKLNGANFQIWKIRMQVILELADVWDVVEQEVGEASATVHEGIARGCGWQAFAAFANMGAYYIVGLPTAILLAFLFKFGSQGLLIGGFCGISTQMVLLLSITLTLNWETQARKARARVCMSTSTTTP